MRPWIIWIVLGALSILFGVLSLGNAVAASIAVTVLTGALLLIAGVFQAVAGFYDPSGWNKVVSILIGIVLGILGLSFMITPTEGVLSLAMLVTLFIGTAGILRLFWAYRLRQTSFFWMMLLSGAMSILLAGYVFANFSSVSTELLGILLGIELLFNGTALLIFGFFLRRHLYDD
ncbi:HdeD family acid-resistance protein [Tropicimonas sp.]|uniref:HdeD family acid-resistance protein n=1 Tax=Tropicimonas sp. TaxID=2067044 RepID=UPI003A845A39